MWAMSWVETAIFIAAVVVAVAAMQVLLAR